MKPEIVEEFERLYYEWKGGSISRMFFIRTVNDMLEAACKICGRPDANFNPIYGQGDDEAARLREMPKKE